MNPVKEELKTDIVKHMYDRVVNVKQTYTLKEIQIQRKQPLYNCLFETGEVVCTLFYHCTFPCRCSF